jgi:hypothetical protein
MDHQRSRERRWRHICDRMQAAADQLQRHGVLAAKGGRKSPAWCVRYNDYLEGRRRQRSIYVGTDPVLVEQARQLLEEFRQIDRDVQELDAALKKLRQIVAFLKRPRRSDRKRPLCTGG